MIWLVATALLVAGGAFAVWPLAGHWQSQAEGVPPERAVDLEVEELELEVAAGRLSVEEATARRRQLRP